MGIPSRQLFINGDWKAPILNKRIPIINPSTQQIIGPLHFPPFLSLTPSVFFFCYSIKFFSTIHRLDCVVVFVTLCCSSGDIPAATKEDVDVAVAAAKAALSRNKGADWASAPGAVRARYLRAIAAKVPSHFNSFLFSLVFHRLTLTLIHRLLRKSLSSLNLKPSIMVNHSMKPLGTW